MYKCYRIRNFKLFRELDFGEFQRVNLITGGNNSGKTAGRRTEAKMFDREALEAALKSGLETR